MTHCDDVFLMQNIICCYSLWDGPLSAYILLNNEIVFANCIEESDDEDRKRIYQLTYFEWNDRCEEWLKDYREYYSHCFYIDGRSLRFNGKRLNEFNDKWNKWHPVKG